MTDIKEFNLVDVKNNSSIINNLNNIYKLWGYEEVSPSFIKPVTSFIRTSNCVLFLVVFSYMSLNKSDKDLPSNIS